LKVDRPAVPRVLIPAARLRRRVEQLGRRIARDYRGRSLVVVCVLKGAFVFAADLVRAIDLPLGVEFLKASSYGAGTVGRSTVRLQLGLSKPLAGKDVLLVEDIIDTGRTLRAVVRAIESMRPASVAVCALLRKKVRARVRIEAEYVGFTVPDRFVVGYGLDLDGRYRNLPYVGVAEE
jgi:hypoxanthine phosphoribosyltransferase